MSEFAFRLENVLELRAEVESLAANELARARADVTAAEAARGTLEQARDSMRAALSELQKAGTDVGKLQAMGLMLERIEQSIQHAEETHTQARERLAERRDAYQRANRERRALEELKSKRQKAWNRDNRRRDQRVMDEFATTRHVRGGMLRQGGES